MNYFIKIVIGLFSVIVINCDGKQNVSECFVYPKQIDSLQIRDLYDTARIYIFTWLCDSKIDNYYRGQFDLKYTSFFLQNDSIELFFTHSLPRAINKTTVQSNYEHKTSIAFNIKTKQKLWGWDINGFSNSLEPNNIRFQRLDAPEVLNFINSHKQILNPCFFELAKKTNLLQD